MKKIKRIALVAHDNKKQDLIKWVEWNHELLIRYNLISTKTTGDLVEKAIKNKLSASDIDDFEVFKLKPGLDGGDVQLGALIIEDRIDLVIFLLDPMQTQPHNSDITALLRIVVLYNIPTAYNLSTAALMISSPLFV
ncbi:methylglyoxal synthase [Vibrio sp. RC27]